MSKGLEICDSFVLTLTYEAGILLHPYCKDEENRELERFKQLADGHTGSVLVSRACVRSCHLPHGVVGRTEGIHAAGNTPWNRSGAGSGLCLFLLFPLSLGQDCITHRELGFKESQDLPRVT